MIKVTRRFVYVVDGKEYANPKEAATAAKEANWSEKKRLVAEMIRRAPTPLDAAAVIMEHFHVYNKTEGKTPGVYKRKKPKVGWHDEPTIMRE